MAERAISEIPMPEIVSTLAERVIARKVLGESDASLETKLCRLGMDAKTAQEAISQIVSERLKSEAKLRRWRRHVESLLHAHVVLRQLDPSEQVIPRLHKPDPEDFLCNYYSKGIPVVLTGIFDDWPAMAKWSPDYLKTRFGQFTVEAMLRRDSDKNYELNKDEHKTKINFDQFLDLVNGPPSNDSYMVAHNFSLPGPLLDMAQDIREIPGLLRPPDNLTEINLWIGPAGTVTPLHHDSSNVLLGQMWGEKQVIVYPWSEIHLLYNEVAGFSRFDPENPDFSSYPLSRHATQMRATISRGEALFIPVGTWHHVRSLSASISLSMSQFVFPNQFVLYDP